MLPPFSLGDTYRQPSCVTCGHSQARLWGGWESALGPASFISSEARVSGIQDTMKDFCAWLFSERPDELQRKGLCKCLQVYRTVPKARPLPGVLSVNKERLKRLRSAAHDLKRQSPSRSPVPWHWHRGRQQTCPAPLSCRSGGFEQRKGNVACSSPHQCLQ